MATTAWAWAQAGDLPGDGREIDHDALTQLVEANRGRKGFGFTHYDPTLENNDLSIQAANAHGFTVNLSAETLAQADEYAALGIAPVVVVVPTGTTKPFMTPGGRHVSICPATVRDDVQCATCGICANPTPRGP